MLQSAGYIVAFSAHGQTLHASHTTFWHIPSPHLSIRQHLLSLSGLLFLLFPRKTILPSPLALIETFYSPNTMRCSPEIFMVPCPSQNVKFFALILYPLLPTEKFLQFIPSAAKDIFFQSINTLQLLLSATICVVSRTSAKILYCNFSISMHLCKSVFYI